MRIAVLGSGNVGASLANGFARIGHEVVLGTRDVSAARLGGALAGRAPGVAVADYEAAVAAAEVVVMAVPGRLVTEVASGIGAEAFAGRIVIDPTNPILVTEAGAESAFGDDDSGAEALQRLLADASVVKAFNQIPAEKMGAPGPEETMPVRICGDDDEAKRRVTGLVESLGWTVRDIGALKKARALERAAVEWYDRTHPR